MDKDKLKINFEQSAGSTKINLDMPVQPINELVATTARCIDTIRNGSEKVGEMLRNSTNVIGKPIEAWLTGKAEEIYANSQLIVANIMYKKEINAIKHLQYIAEEFNNKVEKNEEIPEQIEASDNLLLIQDNASTTSDEEFLKLWAKLYTEEACKPGTVTRRTIKLVETLDASIIKILEEEILPYCDSDGFYWGNKENMLNILTLTDYGLLVKSDGIIFNPQKLNSAQSVELNSNYKLCIYPNYYFNAHYKYSNYKLTTSGIEIYKVLKNRIKIPQDMHIVFKNIKEASQNWQLADPYKNKVHIKQLPNNDEKFIIYDNYDNVVYPTNSPFKSLQEFINAASRNIEVINNDK